MTQPDITIAPADQLAGVTAPTVDSASEASDAWWNRFRRSLCNSRFLGHELTSISTTKPFTFASARFCTASKPTKE
jgi:hypothetical protein